MFALQPLFISLARAWLFIWRLSSYTQLTFWTSHEFLTCSHETCKAQNVCSSQTLGLERLRYKIYARKSVFRLFLVLGRSEYFFVGSVVFQEVKSAPDGVFWRFQKSWGILIWPAKVNCLMSRTPLRSFCAFCPPQIVQTLCARSCSLILAISVATAIHSSSDRFNSGWFIFTFLGKNKKINSDCVTNLAPRFFPPGSDWLFRGSLWKWILRGNDIVPGNWFIFSDPRRHFTIIQLVQIICCDAAFASIIDTQLTKFRLLLAKY